MSIDYKNLSNSELLSLLVEKRNVAATHEAMQQALKIALNSLYGAQANMHFRYFNNNIAEGITLTGQLAIQYITKHLNAILNSRFCTVGVDYAVMGDTDSVYLNLESFVKMIGGIDSIAHDKVADAVDLFCKNEIEPFISKKYKEFEKYLNACSSRLHMKREAISDRALVRAKKNYVLQIIDNEGVRFAEPKIKAAGIETARSSTPELVRKALTKGLSIILNNDEETIQSFVKEFRTEFFSAPLTDIAFPRGVNEIEKWLSKDGRILSGAPIHVKAAIVYNQLLKKHKLHRRFPLVRSGDKIKFVYLKTPNPTHNNTIGFLTVLNSEFGLDEYIDKETQFEKTFLGPLRSFTSIIGWNTEKKISLFDFFDEDIPVPVVKPIQPKAKEHNTTRSLSDFF